MRSGTPGWPGLLRSWWRRIRRGDEEMLMFLGYELELFAVGVIREREGLSIRYGADLNGGNWLIVGVEEDAERLVWVCAPVTLRMLEEVAASRADAWDAV